MGESRKMYVAEDAGEGCWLETPHKPKRAWAKGVDWWKCDRCGQSHNEDDDPYWCKFCGQTRDDDG